MYRSVYFSAQKSLLSTLQIDLIDMRHLPHDGNKWILHIVDHWSKFNLAYPLPQKTAKEVTNALEKWVFPIFTILHSDNGREFVNRLIEDVLAAWPGAVQLVSGRPRILNRKAWWNKLTIYTGTNDEFQNCRVSI